MFPLPRSPRPRKNLLSVQRPCTHATLPSKPSSTCRGCWEATSYGRFEGEGGEVAPVAAGATNWARPCCSRFTTRDASRTAVFSCSIYSSNPRRRASCRRLASSSARHPRRARYVNFKGKAWASRSPELRWWRSVERRQPRRRRWCLADRGERQLVALPRIWLELASRQPRVRWRFFRLLLCANRRVDPHGLWVRVVIWCPSSVSSTQPAPGDTSRLERREISLALPVSWASRLGHVEYLGLPRVARFLTDRHVVDCCQNRQHSTKVQFRRGGSTLKGFTRGPRPSHSNRQYFSHAQCRGPAR